MNPHYERALLLFNRDRFEDAAKELGQAILEDPDDPFQHGLLAINLSRLDRHQQALEEARKTVELAPDHAYGHFVLGLVYMDRERVSEARAAIRTAIEMDPEDPDHFGQLARIEFHGGRWQESIQAADQGLALDPRHDICLHFRSLAMMRQGRNDEAEAGMDTLMEDDPNDPYTHEARGWLSIEQGNPTQARQHFFESLRLDPTNTGAREGLAQAMKAQHFVFGVALKMLLFLGRFRQSVQWLMVIGALVGLRVLRGFAETHPDFYLPIWWFKACFFTLIILLITAHPLFNLVLRFDPQGRQTLTQDQIRASNMNAICLFGALCLGFIWAWRGTGYVGVLAWVVMSLTSGITAAYESSEGWVRERMMRVVLVAALLIPSSFVVLMVWAVVLVTQRVNVPWMFNLGMIYLPMASLLLSVFADDIAGYLEQRRPDSLPRPRFTS